MEYKLNIPINFHQLLDLVLQLPAPAQKRLMSALKSKQSTLPKIQMKTVAQIKAESYNYPTHKQPQKLVGIWENDGEMDFFFNSTQK